MSDYLVLVWPSGDAGAQDRVARLREGRDAAWRVRLERPGLTVWTRGVDAPTVRPLPGGAGLLLGEAYGRRNAAGGEADAAPAGLPATPPAAAAALVRQTWGAYVALLGPERADGGVLRDPSGAMEALVWRLDAPVTVVSSTLEGLPRGAAPRRIALNWDRLAEGLAEPAAAVWAPPLEGLEVVGPGEMRPFREGGATIVAWSPTTHAAPLDFDGPAAAHELSARIDACTAALLGSHDRFVGELSGGLDSAVTAAAATAAGRPTRGAAWLNYFAASPGADERAYARDAAAALGLPLTEIELAPLALDDDSFRDLRWSVRPPITAAGHAHDRDLASRLRAADATAILSGEGGDAVLFQSPTPLVFADRLRAEGWAAIGSPELAAVARWTHRPVWSVLATSVRALRGPLSAAPARIPLAGARLPPRPGWRHPWTAAAAGLPPGKQLHIAGLANAMVHRGASLRTRAARLVCPLLAQPVVELCLGLPTPLLTQGGRDRALARRAYASRLPPSIVGRWGKGSLAGFYGETVLRSLPWLRTHLLDGCLAGAGLFDRAAMARALTPQSLIYRGGTSALLSAAVTESWVRHWQGHVGDSPAAPRVRTILSDVSVR